MVSVKAVLFEAFSISVVPLYEVPDGCLEREAVLMTDDCNETFKERLWEVFEEFVKVTVPLPVELLLVPVSAKMYVLLPDGVTVNHDRFSVTVSVEGE
jgi:hypothetical protein